MGRESFLKKREKDFYRKAKSKVKPPIPVCVIHGIPMKMELSDGCRVFHCPKCRKGD